MRNKYQDNRTKYIKFTWHVSGFNSPVNRQKLSGCMEKSKSQLFLPTGDTL